MDTIFALSTAPGKAGVAIIRVSGAGAFQAVGSLVDGLPRPRQSGLRNIKAPDGSMLDTALVLTFEAGHSFTGEATVEIHCHGSRAVVSAILDALGGQDGLRPAEPGEFTRRALENETLDLAQVEGLADLIDAETEAQRRQAVRVLSGQLGARAEEWREKLIRAAALLEATIDFADEDVPEDVSPEVLSLLESVRAELDREASGVGTAERIREGFEVAIVGAPNVGKSTLLNALAGRDAAITSEVAGTTRDVIEVRMDLNGLPVTLLDTAGLRATEDKVESIGVDRAMKRAEAADLRVFLVEPGQEPAMEPAAEDVVLIGKADLHGCPGNSISGITGHGVPALIDGVSHVLSSRAANAGIATRMRHREALISGSESLARAMAHLGLGSEQTDLAAEELRSAVRRLDSLVGRVDVEAVLDEIFLSFCLGK
ncbi:tRNA uridine-5-carboxymethylaminomethyl(34) synthesis GTPase MnmE [Roseovarius atlanticus]|uniref:tRNA uridine-5-carboxymethylaminomethyl(34) synthesis GTPase MnmE n=1 Tax=Roseovarius atlanticus TaxID=1641875 RepID=UPI001C965ECE|nr:tRNA uridine-5-carboxymethylaminomethyl(34) synthesis GTPase MnmE [Roseovarius atlanticus]MBY5987172.1 tRNA uridine-5-carboxymethylaminomethyl(34) synthesis GTPase MnmE [Roseovarius atlanticus]MBY6125812.1 tRNA uridine-5-carboxymethylaminomethyl(34) synthesis GTPase MnmE [Roseovarius atlanticus]MBY6149727.1 tRNA uridine-5-carboxymethylaminomethyl(34) synthesis GTPase MnmE [Roseovarius atlanticus]